MSLETIASKKTCGGSEEINTGKLGCLIELSSPKHIIAFRKGFVIPKETNFTLAFIKENVQKGIFIPIIGASNFEDMSAEDTYNTNPSGEDRLNLQGLPKFKYMYEETHEFYKELSKMRSFKSYDFIIGDDEGNWSMVKTSSGDYKGYSMGAVTPEMTKRKVKGGENESKSLVFQFLDRKQYDLNYEIFNAQELGWYPEDVPCVNGAFLTFEEIPSDADTILKLKVVLNADKTTPVEGLETTNFRVLVDDVPVVPSLIAETTEGYDLTIAALSTGEVVDVDLWDATLLVGVTSVGDLLFRSNNASEVVIA